MAPIPPTGAPRYDAMSMNDPAAQIQSLLMNIYDDSSRLKIYPGDVVVEAPKIQKALDQIKELIKELSPPSKRGDATLLYDKLVSQTDSLFKHCEAKDIDKFEKLILIEKDIGFILDTCEDFKNLLNNPVR